MESGRTTWHRLLGITALLGIIGIWIRDVGQDEEEKETFARMKLKV
jgi:hypothetical protein